MKKKAIIILLIILGVVLLFSMGIFILTKATPIEDGSLDWIKI
ncbi:hypothetical protein [Clostridium sartagoforme]|nr:hypothetical protein [Clostridium sartagoforme]